MVTVVSNLEFMGSSPVYFHLYNESRHVRSKEQKYPVVIMILRVKVGGQNFPET